MLKMEKYMKFNHMEEAMVGDPRQKDQYAGLKLLSSN